MRLKEGARAQIAAAEYHAAAIIFTSQIMFSYVFSFFQARRFNERCRKFVRNLIELLLHLDNKRMISSY